MKRIVSLVLAFVMLAACAVTLASCAPSDDGAQIKVYLGKEVYDFDPTDYYADNNAEQLMSLLFEPLFYVDDNGNIENAAAESYEIDEESRTITVEIRETYWSDDVRVKAEDYAYAWCNRILNPNNPNPAAALFYDIENAAQVKSGVGSVNDIGVRVVGSYVLEIKYREGADVERLLRNLATVPASPVRQSIVDSSPTYWSKISNGMIFNGPFKIRTVDADTKELTLERNLGYHQPTDAKNYTDNVNPHMLNGFVTGSGEAIEVSVSDIENNTVFFLADAPLSERSANSAVAERHDDMSTYTYVFNTENPLFANAKVRKALSLAIDRSAIVNAITFGKAANGFISDASNGSDENLIPTSANTVLAEQLLLEVDFTGISKQFTLTVENTEQSKTVAELVKASWESLSVGFKVTIKYAEPIESTVNDVTFTDSGIQTLVKEASYGKRKFDVLAVDWQTYTDDSFVGLASMSTALGGYGVDFKNYGQYRNNISGWSNAQYDYLLTAAYNAVGEERELLLKSAEAIICDELPIVPIFFGESFAFVSDDISKLAVDGFGNFVFTDVKLKNYEDYIAKEEE